MAHATTTEKPCVVCGTTIHRPRYADGQLQHASAWRQKTSCSPECAKLARPQSIKRTFTKDCVICGTTFERARHANGKLQNSTEWRRRKTCGRECRDELRLRTYAKRAQADLGGEHPPCVKCGKPVERRPGEKPNRWVRRKTCSARCAGQVAAEPRAKKAKAKRLKRERLAPEGYVFDGRFPTPAGLRSTWQTVTGPDAAPTNAPYVPHKALKRPAALDAALSVHPELATALLDVLTGNWHPTR